MPRKEVGVKMGQEYMFDVQRVLGYKGKILSRVPLWIDQSRCARLLVADNIGSMRKARQIELFKDHVASRSGPSHPLCGHLSACQRIRDSSWSELEREAHRIFPQGRFDLSWERA